MASQLETLLPLEVVLFILERLDSYSVMAFLEVFSWYKKAALIITDHSLPPLFFSLDGVERRFISNKFTDKYHFIQERPNLGLYEMIDRYPIRLVELAYRESLPYVQPCEPSEKSIKKIIPTKLLGSTSFVFIRAGFYDEDEHHQISCTLDNYAPSCKWHIGRPTFFPKEGIEPYAIDEQTLPPQCLSEPGTVLNCGGVENLHTHINANIRSLRLENCMKFEGLYLASLVDLSLIYTNHTETRPLVSNITAPNVRQFVVHYKRKAPLFQGLKKLGKPWTGEWGWPVKRDVLRSRAEPGLLVDMRAFSCFELAEIGSIGCNRDVDSSGASWLDDGVGLRYFMELEFIKNFSFVHFYGVPEEILYSSDLSRVYNLRLHVTHGYKETSKVVSLPKMISLVVQLRDGNSTVPVLSRSSLHWLRIYLMEPECKLDRLLKKDESSSLAGVQIYMGHTKRTTQSLRSPSAFKLNKETWRDFFENAGVDHAELISLVGFEMPLLTKNVNLGHAWAYRERVVCDILSMAHLVELKPLLPKGNTLRVRRLERFLREIKQRQADKDARTTADPAKGPKPKRSASLEPIFIYGLES